MSHALPAGCRALLTSTSVLFRAPGLGQQHSSSTPLISRRWTRATSLPKYADDTYLIVGASRRSTIAAELNHISTWAARNNLRLNANKSREMLIQRSSSFELPPTIAGVERVTSMKILGAIVNDNLRATDHVAELISSCSRGLYALRVHDVFMHGVTKATVVARLLYAAPAWWGFTTVEYRNKLEQFLNRTRRMGYLPGDSSAVSEMVLHSANSLD